MSSNTASIQETPQHKPSTPYVVDAATILASIAAYYGRQDLRAQDILEALACDLTAITKGVR